MMLEFDAQVRKPNNSIGISMENEILVSIVVPFFNGKEFVLETLESIRGQTLSSFEVIVVDDGSTLKEHSEYLVAILESFRDPRFSYSYKENGGLSDARNYGIKKSKSEWIAFIDQDDVWALTKLERQVAVVRSNPEANFIFTDGRFIGDKNGDIQVAAKNNLEAGVVPRTYDMLLKGNFVICSSIIFRKSLVSKVGYSNPNFKICPDYDFIIRFAEQTDFHFINDRLVMYRIHGANTVRNQLKMAAETILLLCDRKIETKKQKCFATYNLISVLLVLFGNWVKKIRAK
jgi:glycosyltransferase involved in cell wall biosynthesis